MNAPSQSIPEDGCTISFSAGTIRPEPTKYRRLSPNGAGKMRALLARFPDLNSWFSSAPVVVNAYQTSVTLPSKVVLVDSYGRWQTLGSGLTLAAQQKRAAVVISAPLMAAHLLLNVIERGIPMPSRILLLLGGYYCPNSLEEFLVRILTTAGTIVTTVHLYGVAEIEAGLLAARREPRCSEMVYHSIDGDWHPEIENGLLRFRRTSDPRDSMPTDDPARLSDEGIRLTIPSHRLSNQIHRLLESFTFDDWMRRTGFLARSSSGIAIQCRASVTPQIIHSESEHFDFCRLFGHSWFDKPQWK